VALASAASTQVNRDEVAGPLIDGAARALAGG
jgi:hypothetical protein